MRKKIKSFFVLFMIFCLAMLSGCSFENTKIPDIQLKVNQSGNTSYYTWQSEESPRLILTEASKAELFKVVDENKPTYKYSYLYELDQVKSRLEFDSSVSEHKLSALDANGELTAETLKGIVLKNNSAYLSGDDAFGYEDVEPDYVYDICTLICDAINAMSEKYPSIDWDRVYCNLGNLKILYNTGMLSYATVNEDMVLSISRGNTEIVLNLKGESSMSDVLVHEVMHMIQIGCSCEDIENASRRGGFCIYWDDFTLNSADWTWFLEGSAERNMCKLTGSEPISYQYKVDYICSFTMSLLLSDNVEADTMDTLSFFADPELLFSAFGCEDEEDREEVLNLMITMQMFQMQPEAFFEKFKEAEGYDPSEDEESLNAFCYEIKPDVCLTLSRVFYRNLAEALTENEMNSNDICFLINLFEGTMNQHLKFSDDTKDEFNKPFAESYTKIREAFFTALSADNPDADFEALYNDYVIADETAMTLNATLDFLDEDKKTFLNERAKWQADLYALGVKF